MDSKTQAAVLAKHHLGRAFAEWYAHKLGFLIVGSVTQMSGQAYKVLWASDVLPGHFLVVPEDSKGAPGETRLMETKALFHPPSAAFGKSAMEDPRAMMEALHAHMAEFIRDRPDAAEWVKTISESLDA